MKIKKDYNYIIGIDPGPKQSAIAVISRIASEYTLHDWDYDKNEEVARFIRNYSSERLVIENVSHYGRGVGQSVFDTCFAVGYFYAVGEPSFDIDLIKKPEVGHIITGSRRATKSQVQRAIKERFKPTGGGSDPYKGIKSKPGPLYGTSNHILDAIGVAIAWIEHMDCEEGHIL
jgi:Holliday junction resolvasome RuvABC endonuclease subunit